MPASPFSFQAGSPFAKPRSIVASDSPQSPWSHTKLTTEEVLATSVAAGLLVSAPTGEQILDAASCPCNQSAAVKYGCETPPAAAEDARSQNLQSALGVMTITAAATEASQPPTHAPPPLDTPPLVDAPPLVNAPPPPSTPATLLTPALPTAPELPEAPTPRDTPTLPTITPCEADAPAAATCLATPAEAHGNDSIQRSMDSSASDGMGVGSRVLTEFGDEGIVRFRGLTSFRDGEWIGVELDRPHGKNDGTVQGTQYFACAPSHGLFARPHKLRALPAQGERMQSGETHSSSADGGAGERSDGDRAVGERRAASFRRLLPPGMPPSPGSRRQADAQTRTAESVDAMLHSDAASGSTSAPPMPTASAGPRPSLKGAGGARAPSVEYALEYSPWPERSLPLGWEEAWGAARSTADDGAKAPTVTVYVSSLSGDRRAAKNSRWAVDFLAAKKVPHAVVDLSVHPHRRPAGSQVSENDTLSQQLPLINVGGLRTLSAGDMQDLEDHGELDALLEQAILQFASLQQ